MRYIIKNGKIYGIYNQNYSALTGKPSINNHELAEGISYSSEDLGIVVGPISQAEYDAMPTHNPQTIYVVYDDEIDPSSTAINYNDLDNKPQINGQVLTGNKPLSSLNIYSKEEVRNLIAAGRSIIVTETKPDSPTPNTLYYVETSTQSVYHVYLYDSNTQEADLGLSTIDLSDYYTKTQADNKFEILTNKVSSVDSSSTNDQYPSAKAVYDGFAPLNSTDIKGGISNFVNPDTAIFNFDTTGVELRQRGEKQFFVQFKNPIDNTNYYAVCKTEIIINNYNSSAAQTVIWQTTTQVNPTTAGASKNFKRCGIISGGVDATQITSATITWKDWYPTEYPATDIPLINSWTADTAQISITGGNAIFSFRQLKLASGTQGRIAQIGYGFPMKNRTVRAYSSMETLTSAQSALAEVGIEATSIAINLYGWTAGRAYYGQVVAPLGY